MRPGKPRGDGWVLPGSCKGAQGTGWCRGVVACAPRVRVWQGGRRVQGGDACKGGARKARSAPRTKKCPAPCYGSRAYTWRRPTLTGPIVPLPLALQRFTSGFGMGPGGSTALWSPEGNFSFSAPCSGRSDLELGLWRPQFGSVACWLAGLWGQPATVSSSHRSLTSTRRKRVFPS